MKKCPSCKREVEDNLEVCPYCGYSFLGDQPTFVNFSDIYFPELEVIKEKLSNKYRVIGLIGKGGFSTVLKLKDTVLDRICALKILSRELILDPEMLERFKREARLYAKLDHPNIVQVYDVGFYKNVAYIIMKYIDGITLKELIKEKAPLELNEIINISEDIASVLEYMHSKGIIHRDIKPANIMIQKSNGKAILTDFGLAKNLETTKFTATGKIMGSPHYLAPEQAKGEKVDERTDIYSLGITMFEMATGKLPFEGETAVQIVLKHIREELPKPSEFNKNIDPDLEKIIYKATRREPERRFSSVKELKEALQKLKRREKIEIPEEKKNRVSFFKLFLLLFFLFIVGVGGYFYRDKLLNKFFSKEEKSAISLKKEKKVEESIPSARKDINKKDGIEKEKNNSKEKENFSNIKKKENIQTQEKKVEKKAAPLSLNLVNVRFSSNAKTKLYIDDRFYGIIPPSKIIKLKKGKHKVLYLRETPTGIKSIEREINIDSSTSRVSQTFNLIAIVKQIAAVPWANVYIDGKLKDMTPVFNVKLKEGKHIITFRHPNFKEFKKTIIVSGGEIVEKIFVNLNIESEKIVQKKIKNKVENYFVKLIYVFPWGNVYIDDKKLGESPISNVKLFSGKHTLRVEHPKYGVIKKIIIVKKDIKKISVNLQTKKIKVEEE